MSAWYWWTLGGVASNVRLAQKGRGRTRWPMGELACPLKNFTCGQETMAACGGRGTGPFADGAGGPMEWELGGKVVGTGEIKPQPHQRRICYEATAV